MKDILEQFNWIYILKGYVRSYIPFMSIDKDAPDKVVFALFPKVSLDGDIFWFKKCIKSPYYSIDFKFSFYEYKNFHGENK